MLSLPRRAALQPFVYLSLLLARPLACSCRVARQRVFGDLLRSPSHRGPASPSAAAAAVRMACLHHTAFSRLQVPRAEQSATLPTAECTLPEAAAGARADHIEDLECSRGMLPVRAPAGEKEKKSCAGPCPIEKTCRWADGAHVL